MFKLAIASLLRIIDPTSPAHHYTAADFAANLPLYTTAEFVAKMPLYTTADLEAHMPLYTTLEWEKSVNTRETCQCLTLKVSPDGTMVVGLARPCACDE